MTAEGPARFSEELAQTAKGPTRASEEPAQPSKGPAQPVEGLFLTPAGASRVCEGRAAASIVVQ